MSIRLHASIPNIRDITLELGRVDNEDWEEFTEYWFNDSDMLISHLDLPIFNNSLLDYNDNVPEDRKLYNLDLLVEMIGYAIDKGYSMFFQYK